MYNTRNNKRNINKTRKVGGVYLVENDYADIDMVDGIDPPLYQGLHSNAIEGIEGNTIPRVGINEINNYVPNPYTGMISTPITLDLTQNQDQPHENLPPPVENIESLLDQIHLSYNTQVMLIRNINQLLRLIYREYRYEYPELVIPRIKQISLGNIYTSLIKMEENIDYIVSLIHDVIQRTNARSALRIYRFIISNIYPIFIVSNSTIDSYYSLATQFNSTMNHDSDYHIQVYEDISSRFHYEKGIFGHLGKLVEISQTIPIRFPIANYPQEHEESDNEEDEEDEM